MEGKASHRCKHEGCATSNNIQGQTGILNFQEDRTKQLARSSACSSDLDDGLDNW